MEYVSIYLVLLLLSSVFHSLPCIDLIEILFITKYFYLEEPNVNGVVFFILNSNCSLAGI